MENKKIYMPLSLALIFSVFCTVYFAAGCASNPQPKAVVVEDTVPVAMEEITVIEEPKAEEKIEAVFNPGTITKEQYNSTKEDVQHFIEELNQVIRNRNYSAWKAALSEEYFEEISSEENLQIISGQPAMKTRRIVLKTPEEYFLHVVVPSRANSRIDDIEFIDENRVKAFTVNTNRAGEEVRLRLYDLERFGDLWKIIN